MILQVYTGPYVQRRQQISETTSVLVKPGHLCAVYTDDTETQPWIGICKDVSSTEVRLAWLEGTYSSSWKPLLQKKGRKKEEVVDTIAKESIILYDFELTRTQHLKKCTQLRLKQIYSDLQS